MFTSTLYQNNPENLRAFQDMVTKPIPIEDFPKVEMNDETARNITTIWESIATLSINWRGNKNAHIIGFYQDRKEYWGQFATYFAKHQQLPVAKEYVEKSNGVGKIAIDLGCGNSPLVELLLKRGWSIIAVDSSKIALNVLKMQYPSEIKSGRLVIVETDVNAYTPSEPADLVIAADILPYLDPAQFKSTWSKIHDKFVKKNGYFIGSLFRYLSDNERLPAMNLIKEMGAWLLPDRRMVRPLLNSEGYDVEQCIYRIDEPGKKDQIVIQFVAKKI